MKDEPWELWKWPWLPAVAGIVLSAIILFGVGGGLNYHYDKKIAELPDDACEIIIVGGSHE